MGKASLGLRIAFASLLLLPPVIADLGRLSWGAISPKNATAGKTLYAGDVSRKVIPQLDLQSN